MRDLLSKDLHDSIPCVFIMVNDKPTLRLVTQALVGEKLIMETVSSLQGFMQIYRPDHHGCLLLDPHLDKTSGPDLLRAARAGNIEIPIIFLTSTADILTAVEIMKLGAADVLQKPIDPQCLRAAVRHAIAHDTHLFGKRKLRADVARRLERLTPREREVMELVVSGRANKQIARQLKLSEKTVEIHRGKVMKKMQANNVAELVLQSVIAAGGTLSEQKSHNLKT